MKKRRKGKTQERTARMQDGKSKWRLGWGGEMRGYA